MDARDARLVLDEARGWARRGLLTPEGLRVVEAEYGAMAATDGSERDSPGGGLAVLYALAGILIGAACVAVPILLDAGEEVVGVWLVGLGSPLLAAGVVLWRRTAPPASPTPSSLAASSPSPSWVLPATTWAASWRHWDSLRPLR